MKKTVIRFATLSALLLSSVLSAQPVVDGTLDAAYGSAIAVQTVQTQFGDSMGGAGGGELDALYASISGGRLYVMMTGNQEPNFNKLDIFIDSVAGGENTLSATPDYDFNSGGNWISSNLSGLTFESGFEADYHLFGRHGGGNYEFDIVNRAGGTSSLVSGDSGVGTGTPGMDVGVINPGAGGNNTTSFLTAPVEFAIDNSNDAGVIGGCDPADAAAAMAVTTGIEFSVSLADLGNPSEVKLVAMYNNGDHNFLSNQMLPGLAAPQCNLGGDGGGNFTGDLGGVDLNQYGGTQSVTIAVPEPSSVALLCIGLVALCGRRR